MSVTLADIHAELLGRVGPYLTKVGLDGTTADGSNAALRAPVRDALVASGLAPASPLAPADADVSALAGFDLMKILDYAELRLLETCWGHWPEFDQSAGSESQSMSQLADRLERRIAALSVRLKEPYVPIGAAGTSPGATARGRLRAGRCIPIEPGGGAWCRGWNS